MTFRSEGEPAYLTSLPFASVDDVEQASKIQTLLCRLAYDGRMILPGVQERSEGGSNLAGVEFATEEVERAKAILSRRTTP